MFTLIEKLKTVKDFRKERGKRHPLCFVLMIIVVGIMLGYTSYRALGYFSQNNQETICKMLGIYPIRTPDYSTIRRVMNGVDWQLLIKLFNVWAEEEYGEREDINCLSMDGKGLNSTVTNYQGNHQDFVMFVSLFSQETLLGFISEKI